MIPTRATWTLRCWARDKTGLPCEPCSPTAVRWCAIGALLKAANVTAAELLVDLPEPIEFIIDRITLTTGKELTTINDYQGYRATVRALRDQVDELRQAVA